MESVFVGDNSVDENHWESVGNDVQKMKIGEIFQLRDSSFTMTCVNCFQEFQYFTEFSLHIQEHFVRGDIVRLSDIKEELPAAVPNDENDDDDDEEPIISEVKCEVIENEMDEFFNDNSAIDAGWSDGGWSDNDLEGNGHSLFEPNESNVENNQFFNENQPVVEGTDYEKVQDKFKCLICSYETEQWKHLKEHLLIHSSPKDVACPLCPKLFATVSYVRKHVNRTHNKKISAKEIKAAQPINKLVAILSTPPEKKKPKRLKSQKNPLNSIEIKPVINPDRKLYTEGISYKKIGEKFQCLTCNRQMNKLDHMREHLLTHDCKKTVFCPICATAFITESYVRKHVNRTHKMRITTEEIKSAQSSIDVVQKRREWQTEKAAKKYPLSSCRVARPHPSMSGEEGSIQCLFCSKLFTKARYAQKHMRLIHAKSLSIGDVMNCQPKNESNANLSDAHDWEASPSVENDSKVEPSKPEGNAQTVKNFECFECHKQFATINSLRIHLKLHSGIKYSCPHCFRLFAMKSYVRDHIVIMHGIKRDDIPKESILEVEGNFSYTSRPIIESYECYLCRNQYRKRTRLREHMHSHVSGPFLCVICGAVFKSTDTLRHHMERHKANPDEQHQCSECGKMYPTRRYMLSHYRTIHLNRRRTKTTVEKDTVAECKVCEKTFLSKHHLNQHMMVHKRDPNELICQICGWQFKERSNLKQHMESHGNNKTNCVVCKKVLSIRYLHEVSFSSFSKFFFSFFAKYLKNCLTNRFFLQHMKIHTGNKDYQCASCGKQFVSRERLKRHMVRHSGEVTFVSSFLNFIELY